MIAPAVCAAKAIHSLRAVRLRRRASKRVPTGSPAAAAAEHAGTGRVGDHRRNARPRGDPGRLQLARHSATPPTTAAVSGGDRQQRVVDADLADQLGSGVVPGVGGVQPVEVREQDEKGRPHVVRHQRGETVVVAIADLVGRDRVVLVDDGHGAERQQTRERAPGVEVLPAVDEVVGNEQRLGGDETVFGEGVVPAAHQPGLPGGGDRLQGGDVGGASFETQCCDTGGDSSRRHDDDVVAGRIGGQRSRRRAS